jgi:hypothetical protein
LDNDNVIDALLELIHKTRAYQGPVGGIFFFLLNYIVLCHSGMDKTILAGLHDCKLM